MSDNTELPTNGRGPRKWIVRNMIGPRKTPAWRFEVNDWDAADIREEAVKHIMCPSCYALSTQPCHTDNGQTYNPREYIHLGRFYPMWHMYVRGVQHGIDYYPRKEEIDSALNAAHERFMENLEKARAGAAPGEWIRFGAEKV